MGSGKHRLRNTRFAPPTRSTATPKVKIKVPQPVPSPRIQRAEPPHAGTEHEVSGERVGPEVNQAGPNLAWWPFPSRRHCSGRAYPEAPGNSAQQPLAWDTVWAGCEPPEEGRSLYPDPLASSARQQWLPGDRAPGH